MYLYYIVNYSWEIVKFLQEDRNIMRVNAIILTLDSTDIHYANDRSVLLVQNENCETILLISVLFNHHYFLAIRSNFMACE